MPLFADPNTNRILIKSLEALIVNYAFSGPGMEVPRSMRQYSDRKRQVDVIVGLESRGFLFAPQLALELSAAFVPVRKKGKLPGKCETEIYEKEYGKDEFQMQAGAIKPGQKVVIVDDI